MVYNFWFYDGQHVLEFNEYFMLCELAKLSFEGFHAFFLKYE